MPYRNHLNYSDGSDKYLKQINLIEANPAGVERSTGHWLERFFMTKEQMRINRANRLKARKYFGLHNGDGYDLHHKDSSWKTDDIERYIQWNPEDLIVLTHGEHTLLHNKNRIYKPASEETKKKRSDTMKDKQYHYNVGADNPMYGKPSDKRKSIAVYYLGEYVESFDSVKDAAKAYNLTGITIGKELKGNHSKLKGYMFLYA